MKLITKIKLHTNLETREDLLDTMKIFNSACQFISDYAFEHKIFNKRNLQNRLYQDIKIQFDLPSQLIVRAFAKVGDSYKTSIKKFKQQIKSYEKLSLEEQVKCKKPTLKCCQFQDTGCVVYDYKLLSYQPNNKISIRSKSKRLIINIDYNPNLDTRTIKGEADLILQDNVFYLHQTINIIEPVPNNNTDFIGVDLGQVHIAVDSDGTYYDNDQIDKHREKYNTRRNSLKKVKTASSRRRLKSMSKRNSRFNKDVNHKISKVIIQKAKALNKGLVMENLINFFNKKKVRRKNRLQRHSWSFFQLRTFCEYKSKLIGIPFVLIDSHYTSQECSVCHYVNKKNRVNQAIFCCKHCGHTDNADFNAAKNIRNRVDVNQLEIVNNFVIYNREVTTNTDVNQVCYKPLALAMG